MRIILFICLLASVSVHAQTPGPPKGLGTMDAYELSLRSFLKEHMDLTYTIHEWPGKIVFLRQKPFTNNFPDTVNGVRVRFIDPAVSTDMDTLARYVHKKQTLNLLDLQQMILREKQGQIWVMPMKTAFDPKKRSLAYPEYSGTDCQYTFDYILGDQTSFNFKQVSCKEL